MNNPESSNLYKPKQALAPTPLLYDELVGDGMEKLAMTTLAEMPPMPPGSIILDDGCGTGAGTAAIVAHVSDASDLHINGVDINQNALAMYKQKAANNAWPAEAIHEDAQALSMPDATFSHAIATAFLFVMPKDGVAAVQEIYRVLKPGGVAAFNSWAYVPNLQPIQVAAARTRPEGTPLPRDGLEKWGDPEFLRRIIHEGGFAHGNITLTKREVHVTTTSIDRYATMLWSFIGGTTTAGWLESDELRWDEAVAIVKEELRKREGYKELDGGRLQLRFVANVAIARK
ncbi:S-adenosyl-L-methionine-dependent methyltransferase [Byssothecium circinans]|uniref:S-adenosyl-L-methionine-dependent methyltransferase n=1 Tax=Byssothecium circinans TaxID=147558 RepID=A0A6A5TD35_9PLEO|nr:S-adenosyl-L-methionine-dependent methyltransferase [Byssothecium circinans]